MLAACLCFAVVLTLMTADAFVRFNQIGLAAALGELADDDDRRCGRGGPATAAQSPRAGRRARRVEAEFPELGSSLINIVQLAEDKRVADQAFRAAAVNDAAARVGEFPFDAAASQTVARAAFPLLHADAARTWPSRSSCWRSLSASPWPATACIPAWDSAVNRLMAPWQFVPAVGKVEIVKVSPATRK